MPQIQGLMPKQQTTDLIPAGAQLPYRAVEESWGGIGVMVFSLIWSAIPAFMLLKAVTSDAPWFAFMFLFVFVLIGVGIFLAGLVSLFSSKEWRFTREAVSCTARGLIGAKEWTEPLDRYNGILAESEYHSGGHNSSSYTLYKLVLKHQNIDERSVELYRSRSEEGWREAQERYARLFGVPALQLTEEGIVERAVESLDKSVRDQVAEGVLEVAFDPSKPPPGENLDVRPEGDCLVMKVGANRFPVGCGVLSVALIGAGLCLILATALGALDLSEQYMMLGGVTVFAGMGGVALGVAAKVVSEELRVSPDEVSRHYTTPWGCFARQRMPAGEVEEVLVAEHHANEALSSVKIVSDEAALTFGSSLSEGEKKWVRDCVITIISAETE